MLLVWNSSVLYWCCSWYTLPRSHRPFPRRQACPREVSVWASHPGSSVHEAKTPLVLPRKPPRPRTLPYTPSWAIQKSGARPFRLTEEHVACPSGYPNLPCWIGQEMQRPSRSSHPIGPEETETKLHLHDQQKCTAATSYRSGTEGRQSLMYL